MKTYIGTVLSAKMKKTITVEVSRRWSHPLYQKTVKRTKKYLVHDEAGTAQAGDRVRFRDSRPYSKKKRFQLITVLSHHAMIDPKLVDAPQIQPEVT